MNFILAYTDGSASIKSKLGGYGVYIINGGKEFMYHEGMSNTKTGRMELTAAITCLQKINDKKAIVDVYSDSMYVVNCVSQGWLKLWRHNNWSNKKNVDLLIKFYDELSKFKTRWPQFYHVKGHTGNSDEHSLGNAIADRLADLKQFKVYREDLSYL
jgi:ribonuclease HI